MLHRVYRPCVRYRFAYQRGSGPRVILWAIGALLSLAWNIPAARAAGDGVVVDCPDLPEAPAAELEARARATLLTSDLPATAAISCAGEDVVIHVQAGDDGVTLKLRVRATTLREEVLRALDRALADLRAGLKPELQGDGVAGAPSTRARRSEAPSERTGSEPPPPAPPVAPAIEPPEATNQAQPPSARKAAVAAQLMGEAWGKYAAVGGGVGAALRVGSAWSCGIRAGAFYPPGLGQFTVIEGHALAELAFTASSLAGLRFGVGAGPSLLFVSPSSELSAQGATFKSAVRLEAQLGRPFRFGRIELAPWLGLRFFSAERGVHVAKQTRLIVGGALPQVGLALSFGE